MTYSIITPADNADFFAQFKTFVVSAGWTIDAQSESELYIHSGDKYLGFRLGNITYNITHNDIFFTCAINTGFDNTKDWFNQPGSSISNLNSSYLPMDSLAATYTRYLPCVYCPNGDITTAVFVGDTNNLIVKIKRGTYVHDAFVITWLSKKHTFTGGAVIAHSSFMLGTTSATTGWNFSANLRGTQSNYLFSCGQNQALPAIPGLLFSVGSSFATVISATNFILTNIVSNSSTTTVNGLVVFSPKPIMDQISPSSYTGIHALITPEFFYLDGSKYCYAGNIEKIKITSRTGLIEQQLLNYGDKQYLILKVVDGDIFAKNTAPTATSNLIAVEL